MWACPTPLPHPPSFATVEIQYRTGLHDIDKALLVYSEQDQSFAKEHIAILFTVNLRDEDSSDVYQ